MDLFSGGVEFVVPGVPAPQGSKRHVGNGVLLESSAKVKPWRHAVALVARTKFRQPLQGPVSVCIEFCMPRTQRMGKKPPPPMVQKPDVDKLARAVLDGLTGPAIADDSQVVALLASKRRADVGEATGARIVVTAIGE